MAASTKRVTLLLLCCLAVHLSAAPTELPSSDAGKSETAEGVKPAVKYVPVMVCDEAEAAGGHQTKDVAPADADESKKASQDEPLNANSVPEEATPQAEAKPVQTSDDESGKTVPAADEPKKETAKDPVEAEKEDVPVKLTSEVVPEETEKAETVKDEANNDEAVPAAVGEASADPVQESVPEEPKNEPVDVPVAEEQSKDDTGAVETPKDSPVADEPTKPASEDNKQDVPVAADEPGKAEVASVDSEKKVDVPVAADEVKEVETFPIAEPGTNSIKSEDVPETEDEKKVDNSPAVEEGKQMADVPVADEEKKAEGAPPGAEGDEEEKNDQDAPIVEEEKAVNVPAADEIKKVEDVPAELEKVQISPVAEEEKKAEVVPAADEAEKAEDVPAVEEVMKPAAPVDDEKKTEVVPAADEAEKVEDVQAIEEVKKPVVPAADETEKVDDAPAAEEVKEPIAPAADEEQKVEDVPAAEEEKKVEDVPATDKTEKVNDTSVAEEEKQVEKVPVADEEKKVPDVPEVVMKPEDVPIAGEVQKLEDAPAAEEEVKGESVPAAEEEKAEDVPAPEEGKKVEDVPAADEEVKSESVPVAEEEKKVEDVPAAADEKAEDVPAPEQEKKVENVPVADENKAEDAANVPAAEDENKAIVTNADDNDSAKKDYSGYRVYRVSVPTEEAAAWILKLEDVPGIEFWADPKLILRRQRFFVTSAADMMVAPEVVTYIEEVFQQARLPFEVLIEDVQKAIENENPAGLPDSGTFNRNGHNLTWERYHEFEDIETYLNYLEATFPDFATVTVFGKTTEGRPLKAIRLHQDTGRKDKKTILIDAGIHAREWITPATLTYMIKELAENPNKYNCIMDEFDWIFIPVLNPDGYTYTHKSNRMWRKTRSTPSSLLFQRTAEESLRADRLARFEDDPVLDDNILDKLKSSLKTKNAFSCTGTDANRNFGFKWLTGGSSRNPCSETFAGPAPFSEPETRALSNFILQNKEQIAMYISLHAYSQMWLIPWGYTEEKPADYQELYTLAKAGVSALQSVSGTSYIIGSIPDLLYIASGSSIDWAKGEAGIKYSFTLELRDAGRHGFLLPANQIIPTGKETWAAMYATAQELARRVYPDPAECNAI